MNKKVKKLIKDKLDKINKITEEKFIDKRLLKVFEEKLMEEIIENYKINYLEIRDYIEQEIEKLVKTYNYYNFHGVIHYTQRNSQAEKDLHKLLGWGSEEEK